MGPVAPNGDMSVEFIKKGEKNIVEEISSVDMDLSLDRIKDMTGRVGVIVDGEIKYSKKNFEEKIVSKENVMEMGSEKLVEELLVKLKQVESVFEKMEKEMNSSEALYGFGAWLTTRKEAVTFSAKHDAGKMADLVSIFIEENGLPEVRDNWTTHLIHPSGEVAV